MAIALRGAASVPAGNPTTGFTVAIDAAVVAGDILVLTFTSRDHTSGTAQPTVVDDDTGGNAWSQFAFSTDRRAQIWWKRATSGTASKTVTVAGCVGSTAGVLKAFSGALTTGTPLAVATQEPNTSGNETHASFNPGVANSMICAAIFNYNNDNSVSSLSFATAGATTMTEKLSTGGSDCANAFGHVLQAGGPTATGNLTWAQTNGVTWSITFIIVASIPVWNQLSYRWRKDDGNETGATWWEAENVNPANGALTLDANVRIRYEVEEGASVNPAVNLTPQLQYNLNGAGWNNVTNASSVVRAAASTQITDGAATTDQLATSAKTFQAGEIEEANGVADAIAGLSNEHTEIEFCVQFRSADLVAGDTVQLRIIDNATAFATYTRVPQYTLASAVFTPDFIGYRFYGDGTESGSTALAGVNGYHSLQISGDTKVHLRTMIREIGGAAGAATDDWQLQYRKNGGAWTDVTAASSNVKADTASGLTDGGATTNRATGITDPGAGSFVAGVQEEADGLIANHQLTAGNFTEHVFALVLVAADLTGANTLEFRITLNGGSPGFTQSVVPTIYTPTTLTLTVSAGADDAYEAHDGTGFDGTGTIVAVASNTAPASRFHGGFRFQNVTVPLRDTIVSALLKPYVITDAVDDLNCAVRCEDVADAISFVTNADVTSRAGTFAGVDWIADALGIGQKTSPDIWPPVQEIVRNPSWASGNDLVNLLRGYADVNKATWFASQENATASSECQLVIQHETPDDLGIALEEILSPGNVSGSTVLVAGDPDIYEGQDSIKRMLFGGTRFGVAGIDTFISVLPNSTHDWDTDIDNWITGINTTPVITRVVGEWDEFAIETPQYVRGYDRTAGAWVERIYYSGYANPAGPIAIGFAQWDGASAFVRNGSPVIQGAESFENYAGGYVLEPSVLYDGDETAGTWHVWYSCRDAASELLRIVHAVSQDGIIWTDKEQVFISATGLVWSPHVKKIGTSHYEMIISSVFQDDGTDGLFRLWSLTPSGDENDWKEPTLILSTTQGQKWHRNYTYGGAIGQDDSGNVWVYFTGRDEHFEGLGPHIGRLRLEPVAITVDLDVAGTITPAGTLASQVNKPLGGTITSGATLANLASKALNGSIAPTATLGAAISKAFGGSATPAGANASQANKALGGSVTPEGALANAAERAASFDGSITPAGSASSQVNKNPAGSIAPSGDPSIDVTKPLAGSIATSGLIADQANKAFGGSVTPTGDLANVEIPGGGVVEELDVAGSITPTGALSNQVNKNPSGTVAPSGDPSIDVNKALSGTITPTGAQSLLVSRAFAGAVTIAGALARQANKLAAGAVTPEGEPRLDADLDLSGAITPTGDLANLPIPGGGGVIEELSVAGTITPTGALSNLFIAGPGAPTPTPTPTPGGVGVPVRYRRSRIPYLPRFIDPWLPRWLQTPIEPKLFDLTINRSINVSGSVSVVPIRGAMLRQVATLAAQGFRDYRPPAPQDEDELWLLGLGDGSTDEELLF